MSLISLARRARFLTLVAGALLIVPLAAEARPGGGGVGSRGTRTNAPPPATNTAPTGAQPVQRTQSPAPGPTQGAPNVAGPAAGAAAAQAARPSFARNMMMGLGAGLLGAGLFGLLSGSGFFSGLASFAGILGFLLQLALIGGVAYLAIRFFRRRSQPQLAGAGAPIPAQMARTGLDPRAGMGAAPMRQAAAPPPAPVAIEVSPADFEAFERLLGEIQQAYSDGDVAALGQRATPEVVGYFADDLAENTRKGLVDRVSQVKLLQGDLAEAWREDEFDYATVAMRYSLVNALTEKASGRIVQGDAAKAQEVTEIWTFARKGRGPWKLSAIQQTA